jgi:hypothetical protein
MSLSVKLAACLDALGFAPDDKIEWDHVPALCRRDRTADGGYDPPANDPRYIRPMRKADHKVKTIGSGATTRGSDIGESTHERHVTESHQEFRRRMLAKDRGESIPRKSKIPSRGFAKGHRPMRSRTAKRNTERRT